MLHLKRTMVHFRKELFVQLLWQFINNPWLILLDPDVIREKKIPIYIWISVSSCDEIPDWERERGRWRERAMEGGRAMLWFGLTGQSLSELPGGTQCGRFHDTKVKRSAEKVYEVYFSVSMVWWSRRHIWTEQILKLSVRTCSVMSFSGLRQIGHWQLPRLFLQWKNSSLMTFKIGCR